MLDLRILTLHLAQRIEYPRAEDNPSEELTQYNGEDFSHGRGAWIIEPGDYLLAQWRETDFSSPREGLACFARQIQRAQKETSGPWILRTLRKDGSTAYQGLRKIQERP